MRRITKREWEAIAEALAFRVADEIVDTDHDLRSYESAFEKVQERLARPAGGSR